MGDLRGSASDQRASRERVVKYAAGMKVVKNEWQRILNGLAALDDTIVQVGWFDSDSATIAFINDRGGNRGDNPPPRPVLGPGMDAAQADVDKIQSRAINQVLRGGSGRTIGQRAAEEAGAVVEQAVRDAIDSVQPANAPETIAGKHGYSAPLRGFSPDRIWNKLEHRVMRKADVSDDDDDDD